MDRSTLKLVAQKWGAFLLPLCLFCIPPYTSRGYALLEVGRVNAYILTHTIKNSFYSFYPVFKILPIVLILSILPFGNKAAGLFSWYVAISYIFFALLQSISFSEMHGLGICSAHLALSLWVAVLWFAEAKSPRNDFTPIRRPLWKYWVVLPALLAFWEPANPISGTPDFSPAYLLTSGAGLAFCMMTPVYLALLTLFYPKVNLTILGTTSLIGILYGLGNLFIAFFLDPGHSWWIGILHIPLLSISIYGLALSAKDLLYQARPFRPAELPRPGAV
jgi:hypothetical protein